MDRQEYIIQISEYGADNWQIAENERIYSNIGDAIERLETLNYLERDHAAKLRKAPLYEYRIVRRMVSDWIPLGYVDTDTVFIDRIAQMIAQAIIEARNEIK